MQGANGHVAFIADSFASTEPEGEAMTKLNQIACFRDKCLSTDELSSCTLQCPASRHHVGGVEWRTTHVYEPNAGEHLN